MNIVLIAVFQASIFSIDGIGEDLSVFRTPFVEVAQKTSIEFAINPEFNILNQGGDFRGMFWTNPFSLSINVPLTKGFTIGAGNLQRIGQSFDGYLEQGDLGIHLVGKGGIDELYLNVSKSFEVGEIALRGSYLFGNSWEIWDYRMSSYSIIDTFDYQYHGRSLMGGIRFKLVKLSYEFLAKITSEGSAGDTVIELPERLSLGLSPALFDGRVDLLFEHSFWHEDKYSSPSRFKIYFAKNNFGIGYTFNPWYLDHVQEHGLDLSLSAPIKNLGTATFNLSCSFRNKDSLREFKIIPQVRLTLKEIFSRRSG